ncbi:MAG: PEP-CTERM sorting domain-containing protein [Armatimonadota bacterium]|nr:PEP-CTERM sorting domain-containing protein [Armatimonadota bacterium]
MKRVCVMMALLAVLSLVSPLLGAPFYQVVDLGTLSGTQSVAYGINSQGEVCGYSYVTGSVSSHAFIWRSGTMTDLNPSGYAGSDAFGINDKGNVVGVTYLNQRQYAFLWKDGAATIIGDGYAEDININDEVVGYAGVLGTGQRHAFWYHNGIMTNLGAGNTAWAINDNRQIVGASMDRYYNDQAVIWQNGQMTYLDTLGGPSGSATDINNYGEIIGHLYDPQGQCHSVLWRNDEIVDLGNLEGFRTYPKAINNQHQIVGFAVMPGGGAFLWQDGVLMCINNLIQSSPGWTVSQAWDINDSGQIVGWGAYNGQFHAVLLNPVPEPSTILALLCAISGLAWCRKTGLRFRS